MKHLLSRPVLFTLLVSLLSLSSQAQSAPQITSMQWDPMATGWVQCALGTGFGASWGTVKVNGVNAGIDSWSDTKACAWLPSGTALGSASFQVTNGAGSSNLVNFTVAPQPTVS